MALAELGVRNAKPADKPQRFFDGGGLYLEVSPSGGKWWRLKYRHAGKERRLSLGTFPDVGLREARVRREAARKLLADGVDPSAERAAQKAAGQRAALGAFEAVARSWLEHRSAAWGSGTLKMVTASLQNDVFPAIGDRPIDGIAPAEIRSIVQSIDARGAGETAGRVFQRIRAVYRYAVAHELVKDDPTYALKPSEILKPRQVHHRASLAESDLPEFLRRWAAYQGDPTTRLALALLMLTAVRPVELRGAKWEEIDMRRSLWRIPASRMKMKTEHLVPLSSPAVELLKSMQALSAGDALVFPSPFYPGKPLSDGTLNSALARMGYKGIATAHGFRTLFSTCAHEAGWNTDVIEKQLAHEDRNEVRSSYNRAQWLEQREKLMKWWGDKLLQVDGGDTLRAAALEPSSGTSSGPLHTVRSPGGGGNAGSMRVTRN